MKKLFNLATAVVIIHSALYFSGCSSYKKQVADFHYFAFQHPDELAKDCAKTFPVKDSLVSGIPQVNIDSTISISLTPGSTFSSLGDLIIAGQLVDSAAGCKIKTIVKTFTKTIRIADTIYRENKAGTDSLKNFITRQSLDLAKSKQAVTDTETDRDKYKSTSNDRLFIIIGLGILLLALTAWNVYKFFTGGVIKNLL